MDIGFILKGHGAWGTEECRTENAEGRFWGRAQCICNIIFFRIHDKFTNFLVKEIW